MIIKKRASTFYLFGEGCQDPARKGKWGWDNNLNMFYTSDLLKVRSLIGHADSTVTDFFADRDKIFLDSSKIDSNITYTAPEGLAYEPYQVDGIKWALERENALIGDTMGSGKTIMALAVANEIEAARILIVCPSIMKIKWSREAAKWLHKPHNIKVLGGSNRMHESDTIHIINYDLLVRDTWLDMFTNQRYDIMIVDESHYCKTFDAKRTRVVLQDSGLAGKCGKVLCLSGTPMLNRPIELFPMLKCLSPQTIDPYNTYYNYAYKFCGARKTRFGLDVSRASNMEELNYRLRSTFMIRRDEIINHLPKRLPTQIIPMSPQGSSKLLLEEEKTLEEYGFSKTKSLAEILGSEQIKGVLAKTQRELAISKVKDAIPFIKDLIDQEGKVVVFGYHIEVMDALKKSLKEYNPCWAYGVMNEYEKQKHVDRFQTDARCKVFLGNYVTCGEGIELTASNTAVFVEAPWAATKFNQNVCRVYRRGQINPVSTFILVVRDSTDEAVIRSNIRKYGYEQKLMNKKLDKLQ